MNEMMFTSRDPIRVPDMARLDGVVVVVVELSLALPSGSIGCSECCLLLSPYRTRLAWATLLSLGRYLPYLT